MKCLHCGRKVEFTRLDAMIAAAMAQARWRAQKPINPITGEVMQPIVPPDFTLVKENVDE